MKPELKRLCWPFNLDQTSLSPSFPSSHIPSAHPLSLLPLHPFSPLHTHTQPWDGDLWLSNKSWRSRHYFSTGSTPGQREKRRGRRTALSTIQPPSISPVGTLPAFLLSLWFIYQHSRLLLLHTSEDVIPEGDPSNIRGIPHWGTGAEMLHMGKK